MLAIGYGAVFFFSIAEVRKSNKAMREAAAEANA